jgi:cell division protein FtsB
MGRIQREHRLAREGVTEGVALACLLLLAGIAIAGPSGVLAWGENQRLLEQRRQEVQRLTLERDELQNRVVHLDPRHVDPDLAGELVRRDLNVVHPDEMVMLLK